MRILLDEMVPRKLKRFFPADEFEVVTVQERGWDSLENGDLLRAARGEFDALVTTDRGIPHQQDLSSAGITVVVLEAKSNRLEHLAPLMDEANAVLRRAGASGVGSPGGVWRVAGGGEATGRET